MKETIGVLVMSYGTPESMDKVEDYFTHIRRGRPPQPEELQDLIDRYEAIGGIFPLRENTNKQVQGLQRELDERNDEYEYRCYQGLRHAPPFIEDGIARMAQDGIRKAVAIVLAPHYSTMSIGAYMERALEAAKSHQIELRSVESYHLHPLFIQAWSERVQESLDEFKQMGAENVRVIFTAHSLPKKILEMNDPYPEQLLETSRAIADQVKIKDWQFAWQSAGNTPFPWLGPDILDVLRDIAQKQEARNVLICPIGFVSDHLEVLYDIDIECQQCAEEVGLQLKRTRSLNDDPLYMKTLADEVSKQWKEALNNERS